MDILISIIVPIYNVEKYLDKCIDSIINQTYTNLEIILVDDGSPDNCPRICDQWALKDQRIIVIHKPNGGLSDARNAGIDIAKGDYFFFLDSDDWIRKDAIQILYSLLNEKDADISCCGVELKDEEGMSISKWSDENCPTLMDSDQSMEQYLSKISIGSIAWNKLYKAELFEEIRYPVGRLHEDEFTTWKLIFKSHRIAYTPECLYYYVQRKGSIVNSGVSIKHFDELSAMEELWNYLEKEKKIQLLKLIVSRYFRKSIELYNGFVYDSKGGSNEGSSRIIELISKKSSSIFKSNSLSAIERIKLIVIIYFPGLYNKILWSKYEKE